MLTKYIGDSASLGKQHKKISLVWDKNPTYLQGGWFGINAPRGLTAVRTYLASLGRFEQLSDPSVR